MENDICKDCGYCKFSKCVKGEGPAGGLLIVGEYTGLVDDQFGRPFLGKGGALLNEALGYADSDRKKVHITNLVMCAPREFMGSNITQPNEKSVECCKKIFLGNLEKINPSLIILLGSSLLKILNIGDTQSISKDRGYLYLLNHNGKDYFVLPTYHPSYVMKEFHNPDIRHHFFLDIYHAVSISKLPNCTPDYSYTYLDTVESAVEFAEFLLNYENKCSVDIETNGLKFFDPNVKILTFAFTLEEGKTFVLPWLHKESPFFKDETIMLKLIPIYKKVFEKLKIIGQNFIFDGAFIYTKLGAFCRKTYWDTMWAAHHCFYGLAPTNLEYISGFFCKIPKWKSMVDNTQLDDTDINLVSKYNAMDSVNTLYVFKTQEILLKKLNLLESFFYLFMRCYTTLLRWRINGIHINEPLRKEISDNFDIEVNKLMKPVYETSYYRKFIDLTISNMKKDFDSFNDRKKKKYNNDFDTYKSTIWSGGLPVIQLRSSVDLGKFMIDCIGLPVVSQGKKYAKFDKNAFSEYLKMYAEGTLKDNRGCLLNNLEVGTVLLAIREARHLEYLLSGFLDNLPDSYHYVEKYDKKIWHNLLPESLPNVVYPDFDISGTATGRSSVREPPIHGLPDEDNSPIKQIIHSRFRGDGGLLFSYDTSQTEYRVIACLANDEVMLNIYRSGSGDIHLFISSKFCRVPEKEVHKSIRRLMKRASFCFTGDTKISLLNGTEVPIKDLVGVPEFWVYSCTPEGKIVPGRGHSARMTKTVNEICVVTLDNGEKVKCTPDHRFMLRNGEYKEAKDLVAGESLMPLYRGITTKDIFPRQVEGYETVYNPGLNSWKPTHRMVCEDLIISDNFDLKNGKGTCHHVNYNKRDNCPANLVILNKKEHDRIHKPSEKVISNLRAIHRDPVFRERMRKVHSDTAKKQWATGSMKTHRDRVNISKDYADMWSKKTSAQAKIQWKDPEFKKLMSRDSLCNICGKICKGPAALGVHKKSHSVSVVKLKKEIVFICCPICNKPCYGKKGLATHTRLAHVNHKVVSSILLHEEQNMYDITVDVHHNFALSAGVFVHNCICFNGGEDTLNSTVIDIMNIADQIKSDSVQKFMERIKPMRNNISQFSEVVKREFLDLFKGVHNYHTDAAKLAATHNYIWSKTGRRRPVPPFTYKGKSKENRFINNPVQTAASDIITPTIAVNTDIQYVKSNLRSKILLTIHDAAYVDMYPSEFNKVVSIALDTVSANKNIDTTFCENDDFCPMLVEFFKKWPFDWLTIPLIADAKIGVSEGDPCSLEVIKPGFYSINGSADRFGKLMTQMCIAKDKGLLDFSVEDKEVKSKDGLDIIFCKMNVTDV